VQCEGAATHSSPRKRRPERPARMATKSAAPSAPIEFHLMHTCQCTHSLQPYWCPLLHHPGGPALPTVTSDTHPQAGTHARTHTHPHGLKQIQPHTIHRIFWHIMAMMTLQPVLQKNYSVPRTRRFPVPSPNPQDHVHQYIRVYSLRYSNQRTLSDLCLRVLVIRTHKARSRQIQA
jgi:hypothetical protein